MSLVAPLTQFQCPEEFPLNHFRNLTRENNVTTSAALEFQGSLCCYFFPHCHLWLTALTGKTLKTGHKVCWNPHSFVTSVSLLLPGARSRSVSCPLSGGTALSLLWLPIRSNQPLLSTPHLRQCLPLPSADHFSILFRLFQNSVK